MGRIEINPTKASVPLGIMEEENPELLKYQAT